MSVWDDIRKEIPACSNHTYFMSAGAGPLHPWALKRSHAYMTTLSEHGDKDWENEVEELDRVRERAARFLNCQVKEVCFLPSTSMAMNFFAMILKARSPGLHVLSFKEEFPSSTLPWLKHGARLSLIEPNAGEYSIEATEEKILKEPDANVLVASHVVSGTGFRQDVDALSKTCEKSKLPLIVNATQAMGAMELNASKFDFVCASIHKWLMSSMGLALCKISEKYLQGLPVAGWLSQKEIWDLDNQKLDEIHEAKALEVGCGAFNQIFCLGETLRWIEEIGGVQKIQERIFSLIEYAMEEFKRAGLELAYHFSKENQSGILMLKHSDPEAFGAKLIDNEVLITPRREGIRVAIHYFNNEEDIARLIKVWKELS